MWRLLCKSGTNGATKKESVAILGAAGKNDMRGDYEWKVYELKSTWLELLFFIFIHHLKRAAVKSSNATG